LVEDAKESAGKDVRDEQPFHACWKSVPEFKPVALKDVMAEQVFHVELKLAPEVRAIAGKVVRAVHPSHALAKLMLWLGSVLNVAAGKEVRPEQFFHA